MDQRIFDQLDVLERGARHETRPRRDDYYDSSTEYSAYDGPRVEYGQSTLMPREYQRTYDDEIADESMVLEDYGQ